MDIKSIPPDQLSEWARVMGKKGGDATKEKYGTQHFKELRKKSSGHWPKGKKRG